MAFQSTPSAWRETKPSLSTWICIVISIHSLRMEGDSHRNLPVSIVEYFNPLPPHGGRLVFFWAMVAATLISIHSLRMEGDVGQRALVWHNSHFNPLPPHGGRRPHPRWMQPQNHFNPLPPHGGRPVRWRLFLFPAAGFQSTPSAWRETKVCYNIYRG